MVGEEHLPGTAPVQQARQPGGDGAPDDDVDRVVLAPYLGAPVGQGEFLGVQDEGFSCPDGGLVREPEQRFLAQRQAGVG
ncbi:hypothetical protein ACIBCT_25390 [Streptosporangium sp. NPDC050855]|uniref:hypothetical protein n=1 Tax=Streptosporangium sp. NPDC050855 TaxID=3366194 RepID=UPI0037B523F7